ncbi:NlpC/P60 family protein [Alteriqipengyuania flavescens]|uniref:NlpC/P60 family protein n=1 Tax=Alteriqipengyuania flavescens TaxID=3053610 RepID=UPI0025B39940|nr:NlpC/P60 family protein [Alteriqipengyuania flavescens]WJY19455.1 NlpC/P60 family protein [Alteriqipengyuania flavescens]WJY25397.1 NlpC/P60 family protein [Alteriqipengyuania flavescens]
MIAHAAPGLRLAEAAIGLVGTPFRLGGRDQATGLDCVGLVAESLLRAGFPVAAPHGYALRNLSIARWLPFAGKAGLRVAVGPILAGDVALCRPGPGQHHLLIHVAGDRFVHAHAALRQTVLTPGPVPWPVEARWRLPQEG